MESQSLTTIEPNPVLTEKITSSNPPFIQKPGRGNLLLTQSPPSRPSLMHLPTLKPPLGDDHHRKLQTTSHSVLTSFWTLLQSYKTFSKAEIIMKISLLVNSLIATASNCDHHRQGMCPRQGSPLRIIRDTSALSSETLVFPRSEAQTRAPDMWYWWSFVLSISHTHIKTEMNRKAYV